MIKKVKEVKLDKNGTIEKIKLSGNKTFTNMETAVRMA